MQVPARRDAALGCAATVAKAGHKPSSDKKRIGQSKGQSAPPPPYLQPNARRAWVRGAWTPNAYSAPMPNCTRLDPSRPEIAILIDAMLRAREVVAGRSWSTSHEPTSENWWADVLADPRARIRRQQHGYRRDGHRTAQKAFYRITDEPRPIIEVACSKCDWKATFSRAELIANYGAEYPLPNLLDHLAAPGCSKIKSQWDRCGVYYVNPIERLER
jgi:hypothetical protein